MEKIKHILVTSALPYANGPLHLGHMVEYIQTDIWVRFQKMHGHHCYYVCGDDAHGTPIMLKAEQLGITPEALIAQYHAEHQHDFAACHIGFDHYSTTHSKENQALATLIYQRLEARGDIDKHVISQAYDPLKNMFLPDRFVKGECPHCHAADQYGDSCEVCGATYNPMQLINPVSVVSGATPITKESLHYFFELSHHQDMLAEWIASGALQEEVANKLQEWMQGTLQAWDISRDAPYFGFEIPNAPGKYFYVWLDAPIGYIASFKQLAAKNPDIDFDAFWRHDSTTELYHFIGKDITYFHSLFWPAMLSAANFRLPTAIFVHGFLTVNGKKMSKSRGTFITVRDYLNHLHPEYLRYYFAAKLSSRIEDIDLNFADFMQRVNADLVGKVVNIASRSAGFLQKYFDNRLATSLDNPDLFATFAHAGDEIATLYEQREFSQAVRAIMTLADQANQYIDQEKPWQLVKEEGQRQRVQAICTTALNLFKTLMIYLHPILPNTASAVETFLNCSLSDWQMHQVALLDHAIQPFKPLLQRIEQQQIDALLTPTQ